jgi:hypothetical protein
MRSLLVTAAQVSSARISFNTGCDSTQASGGFATLSQVYEERRAVANVMDGSYQASMDARYGK